LKNKFSTYFRHILQQYRAQKAKDELRHTGLIFLILNSAYFILALLAEAVWYLPPDVKAGIWFIFFLNTIFVFRIIVILWRVFSRHTEKDNAELLLRIGRRFSSVEDTLLNHYQLAELKDPLSIYAVETFINKNPAERFDKAYIPHPAGKKKNGVLVLMFILVLITFLFYPATKRLLHPAVAYEPDIHYSVSISPPDTTIYAYDSLEVQIHRSAPEHIPLQFFRMDDRGMEPEILNRVNDSLYVFRMERVTESANYLAVLRRPHLFYPRKFFSPDTLRINVLERPRIRTLDIVITPPEYTGLPESRHQGNIDRIRCLRGSNIAIRAVLSDPAGPAFAILDSDTLQMDTEEKNIHLNIVPEQSGLLSLMFSNENNISIREPLNYLLEIEEDAYPHLSIVRPERGDEIILNEELTLPIMAHLRDDFGFTAFRVNYNIRSDYSSSSDTLTYTENIPFSGDTRIQTVVDIWRIRRFISPGSSVIYYFELLDNDMVSGPKRVRSSNYYARYPTLGDLYARQFDEQKNLMEQIEKESQMQDRIVRDIEEVRRELLTKREMDWENKTVLEESIDALERTRDQLEQTRADMEQQKQFMQENTMFSDQVMQTFEQLQNLMNELIDDEMFSLMREIQDKMERNDMSDMEELLRDFEEKAKRFEQTLERMLNVFKRVQQEQRLEELAQRIKEELRHQEELLEKEGTMSAEDLAIQQEKIQKDTEETQSLSRESAELFSEEDRSAFESFLEEMEYMDIPRSMEQAVQSYRQEQRREGRQQSREAAEKMREMNMNFSEMSSSIMQKRWEDISASFRAIFQKTLYISSQQEKLNIFGEDLDTGSPFLHEFTSGANTILSIALDINERLGDLSQKTFLVDKALGIAAAQVIGNLQSGIGNIGDANMQQGKRDLRNAHVSMNRFGRMVLERMHFVSQQQGSASGMEFYLEQLQQMAGQQQALNESMPMPGPGGAPGESMMDQLAELAARQQAIRRALKEIERGIQQGDGGRGVMGDLDRIAKDMEEVINQLRKNQVDRRTIMRQEQIVQRLLDAARSATSRDFKDERESRTAKDVPRISPMGLPEDLGERESLINALRRAVQESDLPPRDKLDMERYLESLLQENLLQRKGDE
jgi:hypothetical protein